jgi:hypothetical protein
MVSWPCGQHPQLKPESHRRRDSAPRREAWATGCNRGASAPVLRTARVGPRWLAHP